MIVGIALATVAHAVIGMLWYGPHLFGAEFMRLANVTPNPEKMKIQMMCSMLSALVLASVMAYFMDRLNVNSFTSALCFGFMAWFGFVATVGLSEVLWCNKPLELYFIKMGNTLVSILTMSLILFFFMAI